MNWRETFSTPVAFLIGRTKVASAERTTQRYLQNITSASCLVDLSTALGPLLDGADGVDTVFTKFATTDSRGKLYWNRSNFVKYIDARVPGNQTVTACLPLLWHIFISSASYPFSAPIAAHIQVSELGEPEIDLAAFRRAFALLVLRGYELLGAKQDGRSLSRQRKIEKSYTDKVPRLARIIFRCLSFPLPEPTPKRVATQEALQLQDVKDTLAFTQPITYDPYPYGPSVGDEQFEAASSRLLCMDDERSAARGSSGISSKTDLRDLIQLLLLLRPEDRRWREGLFMQEAYQRSADIQYVRSVPGPEEASRASDFAPTFVTSRFRVGEDHVTWDLFQAWCSDCPQLIFLFFQLWAGIFGPTLADPSRGLENSSLPTSTANLLCLLKIANFNSEVQCKMRFHDNELQLQRDLQAATLVADLAVKPDLNASEFHETVTKEDWFHLLLIRGGDVEAKASAGGKMNRLIMIFLSPPGKEMRREEGKRQVGYVWQSSAVQLQPDLAMANSGGMTARVLSEELELRAHETAIEQSTSIKINLQQRRADIGVFETRPEVPNDTKGTVQRAVENPFRAANGEDALRVSDVTSTLTLRLTDLKCYRMPGTPLKITRWP